MIAAISADVEVLADAIEQQSGERPDELCPGFLSCLGLELGGEAARVADSIIDAPDIPALTSLWEGLVERRTRRGRPRFDGLLLAEVWSAIFWQTESLRQLKTVGLREAPGAQGFEWCRTLYTTRRGEVFEVQQDGKACWRTEKSREIKQLAVPVRSKIRRDLVREQASGPIDPRLKAGGWRVAGDNLLRDRSWVEHSRRYRQEAIDEANAHAGPPAPTWPHRWLPTDESGLDRCKHCLAWRWLVPGRSTVHRYAAGDVDIEDAIYGRHGRREASLCKREERP